MQWLITIYTVALFGFILIGAVTSPVSLRYNWSNVLVRWRSTLATVLGIALLVAVYVLMQALAVGIEKSSGNTGDPRNLIVVRKGSTAESSSLVQLEQLKTLQYAPEIARGERNEPLISADVVIVMNLVRRGTNAGEANVLLRGIAKRGLPLRPQVELVAGRWFEPGKREIVVSRDRKSTRLNSSHRL